jgi:ATP-binding cassette, subfamily B, bacterial PglK
MIEFIKKIYSLLSIKERKQFFLLVFVVILVGLIEVAGIASIMPFMAVVANPEVVESNRYLYWAYQFLGFTSTNDFLVFLGFLVFLTLLVSNTIKTFALYFELNFIHFRLYSLSRRLLFGYLSQPYVYFLNRNTAVLGKNILQEVSKFTHEVLRPFAQIFSRIVSVLLICSLLFFIDPVLAIIIILILGCAYSLLYSLTQKKMKLVGHERFEANEQRSRLAGEAFGGIKDLKVLGRERFFIDLFSIHARRAESKMVIHGLISSLPSYIMEVLAFGGILIIVLYFLMIRQDFAQVLPVMALYAFAGYRLLPALQGIFTAANLLRFNLPVLDTLHRDLIGLPALSDLSQDKNITALPLRGSLQLESVTFTYPGAELPVVQELNLTIQKNMSIGLVGGTGSGKTTTVDIFLGLLIPQHGSLMVDGIPLGSDDLHRWHRNIGYVPQTIFLSDDSLVSNIAFGVPPEEIDMKAVESAARVANIHDFVVNELPSGYETKVGERGVRLSGGQRQRIGIARALYHNPEVLIMDEATSALDGVTEDAVMQAIRKLSGEKTLITIAHRLTTLKDCDLIYIMENGKIVESGVYSELSVSSRRFMAMAKTGAV